MDRNIFDKINCRAHEFKFLVLLPKILFEFNSTALVDSESIFYDEVDGGVRFFLSIRIFK